MESIRLSSLHVSVHCSFFLLEKLHIPCWLKNITWQHDKDQITLPDSHFFVYSSNFLFLCVCVCLSGLCCSLVVVHYLFETFHLFAISLQANSNFLLQTLILEILAKLMFSIHVYCKIYGHWKYFSTWLSLFADAGRKSDLKVFSHKCLFPAVFCLFKFLKFPHIYLNLWFLSFPELLTVLMNEKELILSWSFKDWFLLMRMEFVIAMVTGTLNLLTLISPSVFVWVALLVDRKAKTNSSTLNEKFEYSLIHSFTQFPTSKIQFNQIETNHPAGDLTQNFVRFFHSQKILLL